MPSLPPPAEPTVEKIEELGEDYEDGIADNYNLETDQVRQTNVVKQGMPRYLHRQWEDQDISWSEIAEACGAANNRIGQWADGEKEWKNVLNSIEVHLDFKIE